MFPPVIKYSVQIGIELFLLSETILRTFLMVGFYKSGNWKRKCCCYSKLVTIDFLTNWKLAYGYKKMMKVSFTAQKDMFLWILKLNIASMGEASLKVHMKSKNVKNEKQCGAKTRCQTSSGLIRKWLLKLYLRLCIL